MMGCKIGEKAIAKYQDSSAFPKACADSFPVKIDSIYVEGGWVTDTVYNYDTQTLFDTITQKHDTIIYKTKVVTNRKVDTIVLTKENTARVKYYNRKAKEDSTIHQNEIKLLKKYLAGIERIKKKRTTQRNIGWGILAALAAYNFRHELVGLFSGGLGNVWGMFLGLFKRKNK